MEHINGCITRNELNVVDSEIVSMAISYRGANYFWIAKFPTNEGHFNGDLLIFDVRYPSGDEGYKTTKFFCDRIE
jgi:hypothetical protein